MFFFTKKEKGVLIPSETSHRHILPDPHDIAANRELEMQRFKWNSFLANHASIFDDEWVWDNRHHAKDHYYDGVIKKKLMQIFNPKVKIRKQVKRLIRGGVPPELRGKVWYLLSGAPKLKTTASQLEQYPSLLSQLPSLEGSQISGDIDKDLMRTFPDLIREDDEVALLTLRRVLMAYAIRNPTVGYCQSMNYICALLLFHMEEEKAFWVFTALLEDILPNNYYVPSLIGGRVDQQVFQSCVASKLPRVFAVFRSTNTLLEPIICPWFFCLYINVLPIYTVCRVWDCLFWEGSIVLFRIGIAMMKCKSLKIQEANDFISIYGVLKSNNLKAYSFELEPAVEGPNNLSADGHVMSDTEYMISGAFGYRWLKSIPPAKVDILRRKFAEVMTAEEEKRKRPKASPTAASMTTSISTTSSQGNGTTTTTMNDNNSNKPPSVQQPHAGEDVISSIFSPGTARKLPRRKLNLMAL
jgi:hypothetical protein